MSIGSRICQRRIELGLSQDELAHRLGYKSRSSINKIELGHHNLTQSKILAIANALETTPSYIMGWDESGESSTGDLPADAIELAKLISSYPKETQASFRQLFQLLSQLPPDMQQAYPALLAAALKAQGLIE